MESTGSANDALIPEYSLSEEKTFTYGKIQYINFKEPFTIDISNYEPEKSQTSTSGKNTFEYKINDKSIIEKLDTISKHFVGKELKVYGRTVLTKCVYIRIKSKLPKITFINDYAIFTDKKDNKYIQFGSK